MASKRPHLFTLFITRFPKLIRIKIKTLVIQGTTNSHLATHFLHNELKKNVC